jgi:hypothetical protein
LHRCRACPSDAPDRRPDLDVIAAAGDVDLEVAVADAVEHRLEVADSEAIDRDVTKARHEMNADMGLVTDRRGGLDLATTGVPLPEVVTQGHRRGRHESGADAAGYNIPIGKRPTALGVPEHARDLVADCVVVTSEFE